jgi:predicted DNA-binding antitoxin AbrB/MazE fold protein
MTHDIDAIYDNGVFRPLEPVTIPDGLRVHLHVEGETASDATEAKARRRAALDEFLRLAAELPLESPADGFSGADHDRVLYREP